MDRIRSAILDGAFNAFRDSFWANYQPTDEATRLDQKQKWLRGRGKGVRGPLFFLNRKQL